MLIIVLCHVMFLIMGIISGVVKQVKITVDNTDGNDYATTAVQCVVLSLT